MKIIVPENNKPRIEMLPLIDVVFLLLVVFIYTMLAMAVHKAMPVSLPESSNVKPEKNSVLSITIDKDFKIFLNKELVDIKDLTTVLKQKANNQKENNVLLFADKSITYQSLFKILDRIRQAGLNQISFQAEAQDPN